MKVSYSELSKGTKIILNNQPCQIIECSPMFKGRGSSVLRAKIKNLTSGEIFSHTFQSSDSFEEAELERKNLKFIYSHRDNFIFSQENNKRIFFSEKEVKDIELFLKPNQIVEALIFREKLINLTLPIKIQLKVKEAPPAIKGDRSQAGTKLITLETGGKLTVPLFVKQGDIVEINTEKKEYVKRVE